MAELAIGVLAEDENDCEVIDRLIGRILAERPKPLPSGWYKLHRRAGSGCAKLRRKAEPWMRELAGRGCRAIIVLHDRDREDEERLRQELSKIPVPAGVRRLVCIPVEEIEAWFFSSAQVLEQICGSDASKHVHANPHLIASPKERLIRLSREAFRKPRYSPNDNARWATFLDLDACARRCPAFRELRTFVDGLVPGA